MKTLANPVKAFVFDLDGTLIDTLPDLALITNRALAEEGYPTRTTQEILSFVGNGLQALIRRALPRNATEDDATRVRKRWRSIHLEVGDALAKPYPHVAHTVQELKRRGCKVAVLSNKYDAGVRQVIDACLPRLFDIAIGEGPNIPRKPDPTGYLRVMKQLGVTPKECAYVGDSPGDVLVARNAGTAAIGVTWGYRDAADFVAQNACPDLWINDIRKLLDLT